MGIFFNEFNRYKKKSESGQIFTPEHITDFMYRILEVNKDDRILDATCGFRVIIMTQANSQVDTRVLELLPKFKIKKMNRWCAV
ncbi:SAM-dependent DNA methyltransferase [Streptococcus anginosus]|uniref:SAM-dependent DNA methyltransferase n=2 Tax=Criibacterium bergeronii TaxID=1871336 RepID=A0A552VCA0_9FIRM|nr:N-6 DNA methylase [Streptococcus anginosus]NJJ07682.1 SAM-dependent DNA methyltransferase [Streptococcus anginosus]TRW28093.1 SAM-dependent DNA methyltransferase [Criibacterium bergeronii]